MIRSIGSVFAGFMTWGAVCVGVNQILFTAFPGEFDENGATQNAGILILLLALSVVYSLMAGFVTAWLAQSRIYAHAAGLCALNLAMGIGIQAQFWDAMPLWYHLPFLAMLAPGILLGAHLRVRLSQRTGAIGEAVV